MAALELSREGRLEDALRCAEDGAAMHPLDVELRCLLALLQLDARRFHQAVDTAASAVYLAPELAMPHLLMGWACERLGDLDGGRRCFRNAVSILQHCPADDPVPLADGENAGRLLAAAEAAVRTMDTRAAR